MSKNSNSNQTNVYSGKKLAIINKKNNALCHTLQSLFYINFYLEIRKQL